MYNIQIFVVLLLGAVHISSEACTLKMGYRTSARLPNIEASPSNVGVYQDLYAEAAKRIGCELEIIRLPKKRILKKLATGELDFYPGLSFSEERSQVIYFFENGLPAADVGLTRESSPSIQSYYDLKGKILLRALGAPKVDKDKYGLMVKIKPDLTIDDAIEIILAKQADFYKDEIGSLAYYLKTHPKIGQIKLQLNCCGGMRALTVGFSRASQHYGEENNSKYNELLALSYANFPSRMARSSVAYLFYRALMQMKQEGFTHQLYHSYYGVHIEALF